MLLDNLLSEMALSNAHTELYFKFLRKKFIVSISHISAITALWHSYFFYIITSDQSHDTATGDSMVEGLHACIIPL